MNKQPTPIRRGDLNEVYDTVTKPPKPLGPLDMMMTAAKNGDSKVFINLSTILATTFGIVMLAAAGRIFLNAMALMEVKTLLETSSTIQTEFRMRANTRFRMLEGDWKREAALMRKNIDKLETDLGAMQYRISRTEDTHGIQSEKSK